MTRPGGTGSSNIDPAALRTVHVISKNEEFKALYYDPERAALRPNLVFVEPDGSIGFETNEVGLKGDPLDPQRKLAVVWGDSVVFGSGRGWSCMLDPLASGWQFLNGGLDGDPYSNILRRASEFNLRHTVALNLLMLGWHPFAPVVAENRPLRRFWFETHRRAEGGRLRPENASIRAALARFLERIPNTVVLTMPTALNPRIIDRDLSCFLMPGDDETGFRFLGNNPYRMEAQGQGYEHIVERNAITREVCGEAGIRVVDLFAAFDTAELADFREHFIDLLHIRPRSYPLLAERIYRSIEDLLA